MQKSGQEFEPRTICSAEGAPEPSGGGGSTTAGSSAASSGNAGSGSASGAPSPSGANASPLSAPSTGLDKPGATPVGSSPGSDSAAVSTPTESGADTFNFDEIFTVTDPSGLASPPAPQPTPQPPQPPVPAAQEAAQVPPVAPTAASGEPAGQSPREQSPTPAPMDPETLASALVAHEVQAIEHLAQNAFQFSPQEIEALETNVIDTLPKLMAKVMVKTQQAMFANMARLVPAMLQKHTQSAKSNEVAENQFFGAFPALKEKHGELVKQLASTYRAANPSVPREQMIQAVGVMAMHMAGLPLTAPNQQPNGQTTPVGIPAPKAPQQSPWQPAGASPALSSTPEEGNPWDILGRVE